MTESPHLELNGAKLIAVIMTRPAVAVWVSAPRRRREAAHVHAFTSRVDAPREIRVILHSGSRRYVSPVFGYNVAQYAASYEICVIPFLLSRRHGR